MFLKKLFNFSKDYRYYLEKGDKFLADERFANARSAYGEALAKIEADSGADPSLVEAVRGKIALTGTMLGRLNLVEAEYALSAGDVKKAGEHLRLIMDLADDATLRENAERLLAGLHAEAPRVEHAEVVPECGRCEETGTEAENDDHLDTDEHILGEDRLALYFQTLPGDLPERYAGMGEEFGRGCLLNLDGDGEGALRVFEELSAGTDSDILKYEMAILRYHQNGDADTCEQLLVKALVLNPGNPLCNIGLVQLYTETGREPEALQVLERMISGDVIPEQARLMQGDLYSHMEDEANAVERYSSLLASPQFAREAATRLVPLLRKQGRNEEAAYLAKKFAVVRG